MAATRDRIVEAGAELFTRQGYNGTGVKQIVTQANAPFGSLYHFFPGGKEQLGAEVVRVSGALFGVLFEAIADAAPDVTTAIDDFFKGAAQHLVDTDFADACPIATVALEVASTSETLRLAAADVFEDWIAAAARRFVDDGVEEARARLLALTILSLLEGAFIFSRTLRSVEPVLVAGEAALAQLAAARQLSAR